MPLTVTIAGLDEDGEEVTYGRLVLRDGEVEPEPAAEEHGELVRSVAKDPILIFDAAHPDGEELNPFDAPEAFLRALHTHYKSAYLRVTAAEDA